MSSDNGIYILETKGPEYRVAHCQAIDNLDYDAPQSLGFNPSYVVIFFENAECFSDKTEALKAASDMFDNYRYVEYGITPLNLCADYSWEEIQELAEKIE